MKKLYYDYGKMWGVFLDESSGRHVIEVECGGSALYPVRLPLSPDEVAAFNKDNKSLDDLAAKIAYSPEKFKSERGA